MDYDTPVIYDANVLFPFHVGHTLVFMASRRLVVAKWTTEIQQEWLDNIAERYPDDLKGCRSRCRAMNKAVLDALVMNYEHLISGIDFPDPNDRRVIAAALHANARGIVTRDKKHFTAKSLKPINLARVDPDDLLVECHERFPDDCLHTLDLARRALTKTKPSLEEYFETLEHCKLTEFVRRVRTPSPKPA